jgi:hypothetical protein
MTDLETILSWFQTGDIPTEQEFQETFSSFRHKDTKIPISEVDGLKSSLGGDEGGIWIFPKPVVPEPQEPTRL